MTKTNITPISKVFLCLDKIMNDEILTEGGLKLYIDPSWDPNWNVSVTGVVFGIPVNSPGNLKLGDEVAFSYRVIADRSCNKKDYYHPVNEPAPYFKTFMNGQGNKLRVVAMPGVISKIWVGTLLDRRGDLLDGIQGSESEIERWLAQFNFSSVQDMKFNNLFDFNGKDYWRADIDDVFVKRVKGKVVSIGDRVICEPIEIDVKQKLELLEGKPMPYKTVKLRYYDRAKVVSGAESLGIKEGETISFEERFCEKYTFWGKQYFLIKKSRVLGTWHE